MLLLVVGLVVIVLVILVVVFLSVRSMRADEGSDYPSRPARRGRAAGGRGEVTDADPRGEARHGEAGRLPARRRPAGDEWLADQEPDVAALPRPRGHRHDQDPASGQRPDARAGARSGQRQESGRGLAGNGPGQPGADWPAGDWGSVSDEEYWAELAADKPLAATARSAPAGLDARPAAALPDRADRREGAGVAPADVAGRPPRRDEDPAPPRQAPAPTMPAAVTPAAQFSLRAGSGRPGEPPTAPGESLSFAEPLAADPATSTGPWTGPVSTVEGLDTDPSIGGIAHWPATGDDGAPTVGWQAPDAFGPDGEAAQAWAAEDPLTSPSFSVPRAYSADSGSYRGSHSRPRPHDGDLADAPDGARYGGHEYRPDPAWDVSSRGTTAPSYGGHADGWRGPDLSYPGSPLEPLPGPAGSVVESSGNWYSAPTPAGDRQFSPEPQYQARDQREDRHATGSRRDPYTDPGQPGLPDYAEGAGYRRPADYGPDHDRSFGSSGYHNCRTGDDGPGETGYDRPTPDSTGYDQPGYGPGQAGHRWPEYSLPDAGYDQPARDSRYQQPGDGADADYRSGPSYGSLGPGAGDGHYSGYHSRRG
jgi:hypothetical protein